MPENRDRQAGRDLSYSRQDQLSGLAKLGWRPSEEHELRLGYIGFDAEFGDSETAADSFGTYDHIRTDTVTLNHTWSPGHPLWDVKSGVWFTRTANDQLRERRDYPFEVHYETNTAGLNLANTAALPAWRGFEQTVDYGFEYFRDWTRPGAVQIAEPLGVTGDPYWFTGATPEGERNVASVFGNWQLLSGEWLELALGLRYDWYNLSGDGEVYAGPNELTGAPPFSLACPPAGWRRPSAPPEHRLAGRPALFQLRRRLPSAAHHQR